MKKFVLLLGLAAALVLIPARVAPADILDLTAGVFPDDELAALSSTGDPFAVGGGTATGFGVSTQFAFSAHLGPNGPSGYAVLKGTVGEAQGKVVCYEQGSPSSAAFTIEVEKGSGSLASGGFVSFIVYDLGGPSSGGDELQINIVSAPCTSSGPPGGGGVVTQGNIVVRG